MMSVAATVLATTATATALAGGIADARTGLVPNRLTYPALALLGLLALSLQAIDVASAGALAIGGTLLTIHLVTRRRGLGLGDVKLGTCIGAGLGPQIGLAALGVAFVAGGAVAGYRLGIAHAARGDAMAFAPYLAGGCAVAFGLAALGLVG
ncbi:MAG: prepilin peptidase [Vulcanimicrobiaceae bacterium]